MDIFCEYIVKKEKTGKDILKTIGIIVALFVVSVVLLALLQGPLYSFGLLLICAAFWGAFRLITAMNIEYEYIVTNSILDIDKISAKRSRKRLESVDFKEIEGCKPAENIKNAGVKVLDASPRGIEDGVYEVTYSKDGERRTLLFKPNKKVITNLKKASPRLVTIRPCDIEE